MEVAVRIDCTPTEARRLIGAPDLSPLGELLAMALEDWLAGLLAGLDPRALAPPPARRGGNAAGGRSGPT
jgi:hypothetical protein